MRLQAPIGIFDSGIGGLTVAKAVKEKLPFEQLIYFGDTEHLPYGDKSAPAIQAFTVKICDFLIHKGCKVILIACNSASSAAYELAKEYVASKAKVFNVIDPMVSYASDNLRDKKIGLIGTRQTVNSGIYESKIAEHLDGKVLHSLATPLLVPMIEEGFVYNRISRDIIDAYLSDSRLEGIEALLLACTHYPLIEREIKTYYDQKVQVVNSGEAVANALYDWLETENLLNTNRQGEDRFYVSDYTESFEMSTKLFFGEAVTLEKYKLWA